MDVSVVIPCYNAERYLAQTIGSVLSQTLPPAEILLVDNGSTDESVAIARQFGEPVRILFEPKKGASSARNTGAAAARGEAIMFLDADDVLGPNVLEALTAALRRSPESIAICPWYCLRKRSGQWIQTPPNRPPRRVDHDDLAAWLTGWFHPPCSVLWSRPAYGQVGEWDERVRVNQDGDIMMRALAMGVELVPASYGRAYYRRAPLGETSLSDARHTKAGIQSRIYVMEKIAALIERRNALRQYGTALGEAFDTIARDCEERYPQLHRQSLDAAAEYSGPVAWRATKRNWSEFRSKCVRVWRRTVPVSKAPTSFPEAVTVRYGLDWTPSEPGPEALSDKKAGAEEPLVSIIIPTYNRAELLPRALDSVLAQTLEDFEVLVIDDASTDHTAEVVEAYEDPRIRYWCQSENRGVSAARNRGLRLAQGAYVAFLDSDDEWMPDKLTRQVRRLEKLPVEVGLTYGGAEMVGDQSNRTYHPTHRGDVFGVLLEENVVYPTSGVMMRREGVDAAGFFDERMPANEDWDYWLRVARSFNADCIEDVLVRHYDVSGHQRISHNHEDDATARARFYEKNVWDMQRAGVAVSFLKESARRLLVPAHWDPPEARSALWRALRRRPFSPSLYVMMGRSMLPRSVYIQLRQVWRKCIQSFGAMSQGSGQHQVSKGANVHS